MKVFSCLTLAAACSAGLTFGVQAQGVSGAIVGRVVDSASQLPIQRTTVSVDGSERTTLTRGDGSFSLALPAGTVRLSVARVGYSTRTIAIPVAAGQTAVVRIALQSLLASTGGVVLTGYGSQRRDAVSGAIATLDADDANVGVISNPSQFLTARVPGVTVTLNNGEPGAGAQIRIRGGSSVALSNDPLYVLDGLPIQNDELEIRSVGIGGTPALGRNPLNAINPRDILSLTVLKDAAATAIYGLRAANGVVLIETKKGRPGRVTTVYETYAALGQAVNSIGLLSGDEYRAFVNAQVAAGKLPAGRAAALGSSNTNWVNATQRTSLTQNHDVSVSGGSQSTTFRASLNFTDYQGIVISNGMQRLQGRLNANHDALNGRLRIGLNVSSARVANDYVPYENTGGFEGGVFQNVAIFNPTRPILATGAAPGASPYYEIGTGRQTIRNPVALANQIADFGTTTRTLGNVTAMFTIIPSLVAQVNVGSDRSTGTRRIYLPRVSPVGAEFAGLGQRSVRALRNTNFQAMLMWSPLTGNDIDFEMLAGYESSKIRKSDISLERRSFTTDAIGYDDPGAGSVSGFSSSSAARSQPLSFFSRATVGYKSRYSMTAVLRRDGTSPFGATRRWEQFPAISGAWLISSESYAKALPLSQLRLRAGYGKQGTEARFDLLRNLTQERTAQSNIALDYGFHDNRFSGSVELYRKKSTDLRLTIPRSPFAFGVDTTNPQFVAAVDYKGLEFALDARLYERPHTSLSLTSGIVIAFERNTVRDLGAADFIETSVVSGEGQSGVNSQRIIRGQPLGTFFGWQFAGFDASGVQTFTKYSVTRDPSGNETRRVATGVTTTPSFDDKVVIGNANPAYSVGFRSNASWGRFDASWLWRAEQRGDVFNNTALEYGSKSNAAVNLNFLRSALSTPESILEPAIYSSRWIENGSFVRLQNVTLGYTFQLVSRPVRIYVAGDNLLLFTSYSGNDPEVFINAGLSSRGTDYLSYPRARMLTTGFRIQF